MTTPHTAARCAPDAEYIAATVRAALDYHDRRGIAVIDLPFKTKIPNDRTDWQDERHDAAALRARFTVGPRNLGGLLGAASGELSDQDFDCREAALAAPAFYPDTGLISGRASHRASHWWYVISDAAAAKPCKWVDPVLKKPDGKPLTILELRFTGQQTVLPPSIHPSGEPYVWEADGAPAIATFAVLHRAGALTAACVLLALRWNRLTGARHDGFLALAGGLLRAGWTADDTEQFCAALAVAASMEPDRVREIPRLVASTAKRIAADEPATGFPALEALLPDWGPKVGLTLRRWLDLSEAAAGGTASGASDTDEEQDPEPIDLFGDPLLTGDPDFPLDAILAPIADFAVDLAERLGVDPALPAMAGLAVAAAAIDDRHQVQPKAQDTSWRESARLWIAAVAESGELKTPLLVAMLRPLRDIETAWWRADQLARTKYETLERRYQLAVKAWDKGPEDAPEPVAPIRPPRRRRIVTDFTTEAVADVLVENPSGGIVFADELSGLIARFDAYTQGGGKDQAAILETYNGGPRVIDRVKKGPTLVPNWSLSMLGGIQPGVIAKLAPRLTDDGFLARFLLFSPTPTVIGTDRAPGPLVEHRYADTIRRLIDLPLPDAEQVYTLDADAQLARRAIEQIVHDVSLLASAAPNLKVHLRKWPGMFARLTLTLHLVAACGRSAAVPSPVILGATACNALALLTDYCLPHAARFYHDTCQQMPDVHARWIAGLLLAEQLTVVTMRDIGRAYRALRSDSAGIAQAMTILSLAGWVSPVGVNGKAPTRWRVNPRIHPTFAARAAEERTRRQARREATQAAARRLRPSEEATP